MTRIRSRTLLSIGCATCLGASSTFAGIGATPQLDTLLAAQTTADNAARASQNKIDKLDDQTQDLVQRYRRALDNTKSIKEYNTHLKAQVESQREELASVQDQIASIDTTSRDVYPLMQRMIDTLDAFVKLDVPYLLDERQKRVAGLRALLDRADVAVSEKYRRIMEAYQIEMEAGRTLEAYDGVIGEGDAKKVVSFLRLGRITLAYQTTDGNETGYWDNDKRQWVVDNDYAHDVQMALRVARKMTAPRLLVVPVHAPVEAQ